jgi:hypothetical protein
LWANLPVVIVKNWSEVTIDFLDREYARLHAQAASYDWSLLQPPHWLAQIDAAANSTDAQRWVVRAVPPGMARTLLDMILPLGFQRLSGLTQAPTPRTTPKLQPTATSAQRTVRR